MAFVSYLIVITQLLATNEILALFKLINKGASASKLPKMLSFRRFQPVQILNSQYDRMKNTTESTKSAPAAQIQIEWIQLKDGCN